MKNKNIALLSLLGLVVLGTITFASSEMLQGKFPFPKDPDSEVFLDDAGFVTLVTTPVTSVVTSEVPSEVASDETSTETSTVTSEVPSTVTTPVASAVAVSAKVAEEAKKRQIRTLTGAILQSAARADYKKNPSKYILTDTQIQRILDLYEIEKSKK